MKEELMKRFLDLIERTGDKVVVTDPAGERPYVLMSLEQYEKLLGSQVEPQQVPVITEPKVVLPRIPAKKEPVVAKKEVPLWRAQLSRELDEAPIKEFSKPGPRPRPVPIVADDARLDSEGEEQFYLEPLE